MQYSQDFDIFLMPAVDRKIRGLTYYQFACSGFAARPATIRE